MRDAFATIILDNFGGIVERSILRIFLRLIVSRFPLEILNVASPINYSLRVANLLPPSLSFPLRDAIAEGTF